jgi:hypothetical protein
MEPWMFWTGQAIQAILTIAAVTFIAFFKGYGSKKGENLATHEDIQKLVDQVRAVTKATEEIKASISTEAWTRQLRKEACYDMLRQIPTMSEALALLVASCCGSPDDMSAEIQFASSYKKYLESEIIVATVCGKNLQPARIALTGAILKVNQAVGRKEAVSAERLFAHVANSCDAFSRACREELQIDDI